MLKKNRWQVVPALLTLALVACEDSITGIPEPVFEVAPVVELAPPPLALLAPALCVRPGVELVSWWTGDGNYDDFLGANPIVSSAGVSFVSAVYDQGFSFGGLNTQIEIDDSATLNPGAFTVDLWAERLGPGQGSDDLYGNMLVQKAIDTDNTGLSHSYFISWRSDGKIAVGVYFDEDLAVAVTSSFYAPVRFVSTDGFVDDVPIFITLSVDGPDVTLYVDGGVQGTFNAVTELGFASSTAVAYGTGPMVIGSNWRPARMINHPRTFQGIIDEVHFFDSALSQATIQAIHAGGTCKIANQAPFVEQVAGGSIDEGGTFVTSVTFTDDDSGAWTASVDYGDGSGANPTVAGTGFDLSHTYAQDGTYTVTVTVTDDLGAEGSSSASVVVNNVAPTVDAGPDATILEGGTFESAGSFVDPGVDDTWTATVDYGDGSGTQALKLSGKTFVLSHMYAGNGSGPFTVTVSVQDDHVAAVGLMLLTVELPPEDEAEVTVVFPLTIHEATVKLARLGWWSRFSRDTYSVEGELPLDLFQRFDPDSEDLTVGFAGTVLVIPAGSLHRDDNKWEYEGSWWLPGVRTMELRDDGRFKIYARGAFEFSLRDVEFGEPVDFSLSLGPDIGQARIRLGGELHFKSLYTGDEYDGDGDGDDDYDDDGDDDDDDGDGDGDDDDHRGRHHDIDRDHDDDDVRSHRRNRLRRFFRRFR